MMCYRATFGDGGWKKECLHFYQDRGNENKRFEECQDCQVH